MVIVTGATMKALMDETDPSVTEMENIIDTAIDTLNLFGAETIPNMTGDAGSKTVTLTSEQNGAVVFAVRQIFYSVFKDLEDATLAPYSIRVSDVMANAELAKTLREAAFRLSTIGKSTITIGTYTAKVADIANNPKMTEELEKAAFRTSTIGLTVIKIGDYSVTVAQLIENPKLREQLEKARFDLSDISFTVGESET